MGVHCSRTTAATGTGAAVEDVLKDDYYYWISQELGVDQVEIRCGAAGEVACRDWYNIHRTFSCVNDEVNCVDVIVELTQGEEAAGATYVRM